jgi:hypothetical protein
VEGARICSPLRLNGCKLDEVLTCGRFVSLARVVLRLGLHMMMMEMKEIGHNAEELLEFERNLIPSYINTLSRV